MAKSNPLAVDNAGPSASTTASTAANTTANQAPAESPAGPATEPAAEPAAGLSPSSVAGCRSAPPAAACDDYYRQGVMMLTGNYLAILSTNRRDVDLDATMAGIRESWRKQTAMAGFVTPEGVQVQVISNK